MIPAPMPQVAKTADATLEADVPLEPVAGLGPFINIRVCRG